MTILPGPEWLHSLLLVVMIVLILTGRRSGMHLQGRRLRREQAGLRAALIAELDAALRAYDLCERLLDEGAPRLLPTRQMFCMYRGNMHRMIGLSPEEAAAMTTAHAAADMLDAAVPIVSPGRRRRLTDPPPGRRVLNLPQMVRSAILSAQAARALIVAAAELAAAKRTMRDRLQGWMPARARAAGDASAQGSGLRPQAAIPSPLTQ